MALPANANRWSGPLKAIAKAVHELGPWFAMLGIVAGVLAVAAKHLQAFCTEAERFAAGALPPAEAPAPRAAERSEEAA